MININNIKFNFIGDIKFKWLNDYDMYKSFINAIKKKVEFRTLLLKIQLKILNILMVYCIQLQ